LLWIVMLLECELIWGIVALVILYRNPCSNPRKKCFLYIVFIFPYGNMFQQYQKIASNINHK
jgi:hypothetical protein